jgi:hypothetical protein
MLLWKFEIPVLQSFMLQRISQQNLTFPLNAKVDSSPNGASPEFRDFDALQLWASEVFTTQHAKFLVKTRFQLTANNSIKFYQMYIISTRFIKNKTYKVFSTLTQVKSVNE